MEYLVPVDEEEGIEELLYHLLDLPKREVDLPTLQQPSQVMLTEVQHQVYATLVTIVRGF